MSSMTPGGDNVEGHEPVEGGRTDQERGRAAGGADVGEGVPGEGLAPDDGEHPDDPRHDRHDPTHDQGHVHRLGREEPRFEQRRPSEAATSITPPG